MEKTKQQLEAEAAARKVISAYRHVFGVEGHRSEAQRVVWEDMKKRARVESTVFVQHDGHLCPMRAAFADGQRTQFLQIQEIVTKGAPDEDKQEPEVKR